MMNEGDLSGLSDIPGDDHSLPSLNLDEMDSEFELVGHVPAVRVPDAPAGDSRSSESSSIQPVVTGAAWEHLMSQSFFNAVDSNSTFALPWEIGPMKDIFNPAVLPTVAKVSGDATNLKDLQLDEPKPVVGHADSTYAVGSMPAYMTAVQNIKDVDYMEHKRAQQSLAVAKWMDILSVSWICSSVGLQLKLDLQSDPTGGEAEATLQSVFGVKSPTTLLKRAASMNQYLRWYAKRPFVKPAVSSPLPLREPEVWEYFLHLRESRAINNKGFTISSTFLETVRFCKHMFGMDSCDVILASRRLVGFAAVEQQYKGPTKQAPPMETEHLLALHNILEHGANPTDRIGAGCFLVATYARARWSDLRFVHHIKYDGYKRNATFDIYTAEHKTSSVGLRRQQFLPMVVPAEGIGGDDWLGTWIKLMKEAGCDWERVPFGPLLPAPKGEGEWCARPLSTSEAAVWLRKLLEGLPRAEEIKAHSMKTTLCVWAARAGFSKEHRAILSHHSSALHGSDVVYSRDLQTGAILRLQMLLRKIRIGLAAGSELEEAQKKITSAFDAGQVSSVRTPVLGAACPGTPGLDGQRVATVEVLEEQSFENVVSEDLPEPAVAVRKEGLLEVKSEEDFENHCLKESNNLGLFTAAEISRGLIEIDSSSGSSSCPSDPESEVSELVDETLDVFKDRAYFEEVPRDEEYFSHKKSGILHRKKLDANTFVCKLRPGRFHTEVTGRFHFKYPRCTKCFAEKHKGVSIAAGIPVVEDSASKKLRSS